jgi:hypothetical protein
LTIDLVVTGRKEEEKRAVQARESYHPAADLAYF